MAVFIDESTDVEGRYVANIVVRTSELEQAEGNVFL